MTRPKHRIPQTGRRSERGKRGARRRGEEMSHQCRVFEYTNTPEINNDSTVCQPHEPENRKHP